MPQLRVYGSRWTPVRAEIEAVLADGEWHLASRLFGRAESRIDPRMAARAWFRANERLGSKAELHERYRANQRAALEAGRRQVFALMLAMMQRIGRIECRGSRIAGSFIRKRDHEVRLRPEVLQEARRRLTECLRGHDLTAPGAIYNDGKSTRCRVCQAESVKRVRAKKAVA